ncbi:RdRp [Bemisia tabaci toti-like virus 1]|uniref:RNA-directed RNA polymerase n=1 Tax=Bemisia tabaci toti-like virus 1 TaxID=2838153 RepID=A0A8E6Y5K2_9VIRU|nr:RdRp [Bemisia tabaci toti-like virus 1]
MHQPSYSGNYVLVDYVNALLPKYIATPSLAANKLVSTFLASIEQRTKGVRTHGVNYLQLWLLANPAIKRLPDAEASAFWNTLTLANKRGVAISYLLYLACGDKDQYQLLFNSLVSKLYAGRDWCHPLTFSGETDQPVVDPGTNPVLDLWKRSDPHSFTLFSKHPSPRILPQIALQQIQLKFSMVGGVPVWFPKLTIHTNRLQLKKLSALYPYTSMADKQHTTTRVWSYLNSLLNGSWRGEMSTLHPQLDLPSRSSLLKSVNSVLAHLMVGTPQPLVMVALLTCVDEKYQTSPPWVYMTQSQLLLDTYPNVTKNLKDLSTGLKRCSTLPDGTPVSDNLVAKFMYWELACGRALMLSDWHQEYLDRCTTTYHITTHLPSNKPPRWREEVTGHVEEDPRFYELLTNYMVQLLNIVIPTRIRKETFKAFLLRRSEWMTSGSSSGEAVTINGKRYPVNKRGWSETLDVNYYAQLLYTSEPIEEATASEKMESGKARAIYGTKPLHYVISSYATDKFEERLRLVQGLEKGVSGLEGLVREIKRASLSSSEHHLTMLDFANFNIQHSPRSQAVLHEVCHRLGPEHHAPIDWLQAHLWLAKSKYNMWVELPGTDGSTQRTRVRVVQGLFSGTKTTDLTNTALNWCYVRVAKQLVAEQYALHPLGLYTVHQGDDIWLSNLLVVWSAILFYTMNSMGFVFAPTKQMIGLHRGEYLRVLSTHGQAIGYLARSIVNMLIKPVQQAMPLTPNENLSSTNTALGTLSRRGLPFVSLVALHFDLSRHWRKLRAFPGDPTAIALPLKVVYYPTPLNGYDCPPPLTLVSSDKQPLPQINPEFQLDSVLAQLPHRMTSDWLTTIVAKVGSNHPINFHGLVQTQKLSNYFSAIKGLGTTRAFKALKRKWKQVIQSDPTLLINPTLRALSLDDPESWALSKTSFSHTNLLTPANGIYITPKDILNTVIGKMRQPDIVFAEPVNLISAIIGFSASTPFKSLQATQLALGITEMEAIIYMLEFSSLGQPNRDLARQHLAKLFMYNSIIPLHVLLFASFGFLGNYRQVVHPSIVLTVNTVVKSDLADRMLSMQRAPLAYWLELWEHRAALLLRAIIAKDRRSATRILY